MPKEESKRVLKKKSVIELTKDALEKLRQWLSDGTRKENTAFELIATTAYLRNILHQQLEEEGFDDLSVGTLDALGGLWQALERPCAKDSIPGDQK